MDGEKGLLIGKLLSKTMPNGFQGKTKLLHLPPLIAHPWLKTF